MKYQKTRYVLARVLAVILTLTAVFGLSAPLITQAASNVSVLYRYDGDGTETGTGNFTQLRSGGEIVGFEVSLHIPDLNSVTPVRYIMEPEYVSQQELKQENTMQQVEDAKDTESWTVDQSDGTMYFFLDENNGWRLVITDAAAGSRFYVMEKTMDGGSTWECINDDPFSGQLGVAEGLIFYDENFGVAGITGASQSYSRLYVTRDGGRTLKK